MDKLGYAKKVLSPIKKKMLLIFRLRNSKFYSLDKAKTISISSFLSV